MSEPAVVMEGTAAAADGASVSAAVVDDAAREHGGVTPTHGRNIQEQKAWFIQRAKAHRAAALEANKKQLSSAELLAAAAQPPNSSEMSTEAACAASSPPTGAAVEVASGSAVAAATQEATPGPVAVDVSDSQPADSCSLPERGKGPPAGVSEPSPLRGTPRDGPQHPTP